jgi:hypothetical protein
VVTASELKVPSQRLYDILEYALAVLLVCIGYNEAVVAGQWPVPESFPPLQTPLRTVNYQRFPACPVHFADEPNVAVTSEVPVGPSLPVRDDARIPDLLFVRDGDRKLMEEQRSYAIDSQGKVPDFVLEVASPTTGRVGCTDKRRDYERFSTS